MSDSSDKLLEITCSKYLQEVEKFNWLPSEVISLERFHFLDTKCVYILHTSNVTIL